MPIFEPRAVNKAVAQALRESDIPANAKGAVVVVVTRDSAGQVVVKGVVSRKIRDVWRISGVVEIDHEAHIDGGLEIKATW